MEILVLLILLMAVFLYVMIRGALEEKDKKKKSGKTIQVLPLFSCFFSAPPYPAHTAAGIAQRISALEHLLYKASNELHIRTALYFWRNRRHDLAHVLNRSRTDFGYCFLHNLLDLVFV